MNILEKIVFRKNYLFNRDKYKYLAISFSQEGEDKILEDYFLNQQSGFYVEVGAHHPQRFSNSYLFYLKGWRGINIDAMPGSMIEFNKVRPLDTNLEIGVSDKPGIIPFYVFNEKALNTFDEGVAKDRQEKEDIHLDKVIEVAVERLENVLEKYLPSNTIIDFLSIDVEGHDLEVLKSNNWDIYRPKVILIEDNVEEEQGYSRIRQYIESKGYSFFARTNRNLFFKLH
jgi:FkbM family methyltransferase